jgi:nucleotide-binding universal stress UspA family protein
MSIRTILFPVDFSVQSRAVRPFVKALAEKFGATLHLLHLIQVPRGFEEIPVVIDDLISSQQGSAEDTISSFFEVDPPSVPVRTAVQLGDPGQEIACYAQRNQADLIMMPTHGYGPFRAFLLGSVTAKVLHDSPVPVWTAPHAADLSPTHATCRKILCTVDATPNSASTIEWASGYAREVGASLRLLHVIPGIEPVHYDRDFQELLRKGAIERLEHFLNVDAPLSVVTGDVATAVREEALRDDSDLIVIGRGHSQERLGRLRTQSYAIIRKAPCPVLST